MVGLVSTVVQFFPPKPKFTEKDLPDLHDKVYIVTGSNTGAGKETAQLLYSRNAKVYMAARSEEKTLRAIDSIKIAVPHSTGQLIFLRLDLADLNTIKGAAHEFLSKERELHVLINNAGLGYPPRGSKSAQGYELALGVNCIGTFLFTKLLTPTIVATAKASPPNTVRVVWVCSSAAEGVHPTQDALNNLDYHDDRSELDKYCISKMGNYLLAAEFAARYKADGVVSTPINPGALQSDFWRNQSALTVCMLKPILYAPIYGAYTTLWAGFAPEVTVEKSGTFVAPFGRFWTVSNELRAASKTRSEGGTGIGQQFWQWTEAQVRSYV